MFIKQTNQQQANEKRNVEPYGYRKGVVDFYVNNE